MNETNDGTPSYNNHNDNDNDNNEIRINNQKKKPTTTVPPPVFSSSSSLGASLVAGGMAGFCVDVALFPIDTIKTRLQAPGGFWKAGGFRNMYNGLGAVAFGSAPGAALFFSIYEQTKLQLQQQQPQSHHHSHHHHGSSSSVVPGMQSDTTVHMTAASVGEIMACSVRVPTEVIKARMQTSPVKLGIMETISILWNEPLTGASSTRAAAGLHGLYRGFGITLFREIPFAMIQFPLYEKGKIWCSDTFNNGQGCSALTAAACGSLSGAIAGAITTPLDVLKTRYMLGSDGKYRYKGLGDVLHRTLRTDGVRALFHGLEPRVFWISLGGFVFFGAYEASLRLLRPLFH